MGVVYGDIGTSPLYALKEAAKAAAHGGPLTHSAVLGVVSLILWALVVVVTLKYVVILLRADNNGEGGTLALMALAQRAATRGGAAIVLLGIISGALFYGDAVITPALSVLSAIEGIKLVTSTFDPYVVPLTVVILVALFAVQSRGTARVAAFFGPVMCVWFAVIAIAALPQIVGNWVRSPWLAYGLAAIPFVALHAYNWVGMTDVLVICLCLSYLTWRSAGIEQSVVVHACSNLSVFIPQALRPDAVTSTEVSWLGGLVTALITVAVTAGVAAGSKAGVAKQKLPSRP